MAFPLFDKVLFYIDYARIDCKGGVFIIYLKAFGWKYTFLLLLRLDLFYSSVACWISYRLQVVGISFRYVVFIYSQPKQGLNNNLYCLQIVWAWIESYSEPNSVV